MNRCDECKHKDSCVCIPYGCECFELDLEEHDKQIKADLLNKVMQKRKTIIDDDGVMYKAVLLKDIEDLKAEVSK